MKQHLRLALLYEDDEVFVEIKPEVLKERIGEELYNKLVEELKLATFTK